MIPKQHKELVQLTCNSIVDKIQVRAKYFQDELEEMGGTPALQLMGEKDCLTLVIVNKDHTPSKNMTPSYDILLEAEDLEAILDVFYTNTVPKATGLKKLLLDVRNIFVNGLMKITSSSSGNPFR